MENFEEFIENKKEEIKVVEKRFRPAMKNIIPFEILEENFKGDEDILAFVFEAKNSCREYLRVILKYMDFEQIAKSGDRDDAEVLAAVDELRRRTHDALVDNFNALRRLCAKNKIPLAAFENIDVQNRTAYGRIALDTVYDEIKKILERKKNNANGQQI